MANNGSDEGYPKWGNDNSSTVPFDPDNLVNKAKGKPNKLPEEETLHDGETNVAVSHFGSHKTPSFQMSEIEHHAPCINPSCKSYGKYHPNCLCYAGPGGTSLENSRFAKGGMIHEKFCSKNQKHNSNCEYFDNGGDVQSVPQGTGLPQFHDDPLDTVNHVGADQGLLGLLKSIGFPNLQDPDKHVQTLQDAKNAYTGLETKGAGSKLGSNIKSGDYDGASETMSGHPLIGSISKKNLSPVLQRLSHPLMSQEPNPHGFRSGAEYLDSSIKGQSKLDKHMDKLFGKESFPDKADVDPKTREELKEHLESLQMNPSKMLEIGGKLGHYLPEHGVAVAAHSAQAISYLNSLKPTRSLNRPLDSMAPMGKMAEARYHRALDIAQKPLSVLHAAKDGTLNSLDIKTLSIVYPRLHQAMITKAGEKLIEAKTEGIEIPYKQKMGLSRLLGQPLDSSMTPQGMQAIIHSAGPQQMANQMVKQKKASGVELNQINKVNSMSETPLQARQSDVKE